MGRSSAWIVFSSGHFFSCLFFAQVKFTLIDVDTKKTDTEGLRVDFLLNKVLYRQFKLKTEELTERLDRRFFEPRRNMMSVGR